MNTENKYTPGTYIAFGFNFHNGGPTEVIVTNITSNDNGKVLVHFLYGHHSLSEYFYPDDYWKIIAIGDNTKGTHTLNGWSGKYIIQNQNHPLIKEFKTI